MSEAIFFCLLFCQQGLHQPAEVENKDDNQCPDDRADFFDFAGCNHSDQISDKAQRDTVGNRVGQNHRNDGDKASSRVNNVVPVHAAQLLCHQDTNNNQGRSGYLIGNGAQDDWRDEDGQEEQNAGGAGSQTGSAANLNAGGGFNKGSNGGSTHSSTCNSTDCVSQQCSFCVFQLALFVDQTNTVADGNQSAGGIKEVNKQEGEDDNKRIARVREQLAETVDKCAGSLHGEVGGDILLHAVL